MDRLLKAEADVKRLTAEREALREAVRVSLKALSEEADGEYWSVRKWLDDRDIFNDDLSGHRVVTACLAAALQAPVAPPKAKLCVLADDSPDCLTHDERCDWVECTGWRCPVSGQIVKAAPQEKP